MLHSSWPQSPCNPNEICVAFNGVIYNSVELAVDLRKRGHLLAAGTDAELVLHLYEEYGPDFPRFLHGMFAFGLLAHRQLILARDRLGFKPLYYSFLDGAATFVFASEIKAFFQCSDFTANLDVQAFTDSVVLGHPVGSETFFQGVKSVPPGHTITVSCDDPIRSLDPRPYFPAGTTRDSAVSSHEVEEKLLALLENAVRSHSREVANLALALSGGLDSTILGLLLRETENRQVLTLAIADREDHPDMVQAKLVADAIGSEHIPVILRFDEYCAAIFDCVLADEQPDSPYSIPFYLLCRKMAGYANVCLIGEGADALLGGNEDYLNRSYGNALSDLAQRLPLLGTIGLSLSDRAREIVGRLTSARTFNEYSELLFGFRLSDSIERLHLDFVEKCASAAGVEMRLPFLDDNVLAFARQLPVQMLVRPDLGITKYTLRRLSFAKFGDRVVNALLREKLGMPSAGVSLYNHFDRYCDRQLPHDYLKLHPFGYCFATKSRLVMFDLFCEIFMVHRGDASRVGNLEEFMRSIRPGRTRYSFS
jgi:asparagine synthase (glutamine-hydrolysing)